MIEHWIAQVTISAQWSFGIAFAQRIALVDVVAKFFCGPFVFG